MKTYTLRIYKHASLNRFLIKVFKIDGIYARPSEIVEL